MSKSEKIGLIYGLIFTTTSFFLRGYSYGIGDQAIHIPLIYKLYNPSLYGSDQLFSVGQQYLSFFYLFFANILKILPVSLETIFLIIYLVNNLIFFLAIFYIGRKFLKNYWSVIFLGLLFILPSHIAGSATQSVEFSLVPRGIAFSLSLWSIYFLISKKKLLFISISFLILLIHPLSFIFLGIVIVLYILTNSKYFRRYYVFLLITSIMVALITPSIDNISWLKVLRDRNSYAFIDLWALKAWVNLLIIIIPIICYLLLYRKKNDLYKLVLAVFSGCILAFVIQLAATYISPSDLIIKLQLGRVWIYSFYISCLIISFIVDKFSINTQKILLVILLISVITISFGSNYRLFKKQNSYWIDIQTWAFKNTKTNCIFLTPFNHQGFRVYSLRPIVGEYKDGTLSFYSESFSEQWFNKQKELTNWEQQDYASLLKLRNKYNFSYLVTNKELSIPIEVVYQNELYAIYSLNQKDTNCLNINY